MKIEIKQRWIDALRSGTYKQLMGFLRKNNCFCATGVLCDLYAQEKQIEWELDIGHSGRMSILGVWGAAPDEVLDWAGCGVEDRTIQYPLKLDAVSRKNDNGHTFEELANYIEKEL